MNSLTRDTLPKSSQYILEICYNNQIQITEKMKNEFWDGLAIYGPFTLAKREFIRDKLLGADVILMSYLYRDIMISIYLGEPYKSAIRNSYEQHLMKLGVINEFNIRDYDKLTTKMIESDKKEVVPVNEAKKTRQGLLQLITKATLRETRINQLFGVQKLAEIKYPAPAPMINEGQSTLLDSDTPREE